MSFEEIIKAEMYAEPGGVDTAAMGQDPGKRGIGDGAGDQGSGICRKGSERGREPVPVVLPENKILSGPSSAR